MAIKQRKQITGTSAQIKSFAGHEGVLAFDKQTKHLHVLSGTEGKTTELANKSDIPTVDGNSSDYVGTIKELNFDVNTGAVTVVKSNDTVVPRKLATDLYVADKLKTKEDKGTAFSKEESDSRYATLEGLQKYQITINGVSAMSNAFKKSVDEGRLSEYTLTEPGGDTAMVLLGADEGNAKTILTHILAGEHFEEPYYVRAKENRGELNGYEKTQQFSMDTIDLSSIADTSLSLSSTPSLFLGELFTNNPLYSATKVIRTRQITSITLGGHLRWLTAKAPTIEPNSGGLIVVHIADGNGIVQLHLIPK